MFFTFAYGALAVATASISLAAVNKTLWKLGVLFLVHGAVNVGIHLYTNGAHLPVLSSGFDIVAAVMCYFIWVKYKNDVASQCQAVFICQAWWSMYWAYSGESLLPQTALTTLFVLNAAIIIHNSIKTLRSKNRRYQNVKCYKFDRRINSRDQNFLCPNLHEPTRGDLAK